MSQEIRIEYLMMSLLTLLTPYDTRINHVNTQWHHLTLINHGNIWWYLGTNKRTVTYKTLTVSRRRTITMRLVWVEHWWQILRGIGDFKMMWRHQNRVKNAWVHQNTVVGMFQDHWILMMSQYSPVYKIFL